MTQRITHFLQFTDEASAKAALPSFWWSFNGAWDWNRTFVDAPVMVMRKTGTFATDPMTGAQVEVLQAVTGYFVNAILPALNTSLPGLTGAGHRDPVTKAWVVDSGATPVTPQREFA